MLRHEHVHQFVLHAVRVLVLVYHHVAELAARAVEQLRVAAPEFERVQQQVVEVKAVRRAQGRLIPLVDVRHVRLVLLFRFIGHGTGPLRVRRAVLVLVETDGCLERSRAEPALARGHVVHHAAQQGTRVTLSRNTEVAPVSQVLDMPPQHAQAERVKRGQGHLLGGAPAYQLAHALAHFRSRLVGESDRHDLLRLREPPRENVGDAPRDHAGLAAARPRQHQHRPFGLAHRLALLRIESFEMSGCAVGHGERSIGLYFSQRGAPILPAWRGPSLPAAAAPQESLCHIFTLC